MRRSLLRLGLALTTPWRILDLQPLLGTLLATTPLANQVRIELSSSKTFTVNALNGNYEQRTTYSRRFVILCPPSQFVQQLGCGRSSSSVAFTSHRNSSK